MFQPVRTSARTVTIVGVSTALVAAGALAVAAPVLAGADVTRSSGSVVRFVPSTPGVQPVPVGAQARVHSVATAAGRTIVTLTVTGMAPNETYGAHAHRLGCDEDKGGKHFQGHTDLSKPLDHPVNANPANEIWLDLTTNAAGNGSARSVVDFQFQPSAGPRSVILHAEHTNPGLPDGTKAGTAGDKLACLPAF